MGGASSKFNEVWFSIKIAPSGSNPGLSDDSQSRSGSRENAVSLFEEGSDVQSEGTRCDNVDVGLRSIS